MLLRPIPPSESSATLAEDVVDDDSDPGGWSEAAVVAQDAIAELPLSSLLPPGRYVFSNTTARILVQR